MEKWIGWGRDKEKSWRLITVLGNGIGISLSSQPRLVGRDFGADADTT